MRCLIPFLVLAIAAPAAAQEAADSACFVLPAADAPPRVQSLSVTSLGEITLILRGAPHVAFEFDCDLSGPGPAHCPVECDGGSVTLTRKGNSIEADFRHLRIEAARMESLTFGQTAFDADGLHFDGNFRLDGAAPAQCDRRRIGQPFDLQAGDHYPAVERLETALAEGGYLAEVPDWTFTRDTAAAVAAFQSEIGLPDTGQADRDLLRRLGIFTRYGFGGC
ncbi:peptidoglycan-binding domain-containing protein [Aphanothece microscopica]|uniref:peptidoglycan-binding domain-containing protein n=1 Tax=Aphanothece microscopica TaxID=1049561 RepID=UPI0039850690